MKKRTIVFTTAAILAILVAVPFTYAQRSRGFGAAHMGHGDFGGVGMLGHLGKARQALNLSDQQVADIKAIFTDLRTQNEPYRTQMRGGMGSIAETLVNDPNNVAAAQALLAKQEDAEHAMKANALVAASKALSVLTPDQRTKLAEHIRARLSR